MSAYEDMEYRKYTYKSELDKALNTLVGILKGVSLDNEINIMEIEELQNWCQLHQGVRKQHPFNEFVPMVENAIKDNVLSEDEIQDMLWLCKNIKTDSIYFDLITSDIQKLHGLLHGILADNQINDEEIHMLREWIDENDHLMNSYPYDEISSLLLSVLSDGKIDNKEKALLKAFFSEFIYLKESYNINQLEIENIRSILKIGGICAACPEIRILESSFCFTGASSRIKRDEIKYLVESLGGIYNNNVIRDTKYLVVGNDGNPCWAFSCYGRKVEKAMQMRKQGHLITIVHENDFWDAVADMK